MRHKLTQLSVQALKSGNRSDGGGLTITVDKDGHKTWSFRFQWLGKGREMGLGAFPTIGLAEAREKADVARKQVAAGINPIDARKAARAAARAALEPPKPALSFAEIAEMYIQAHEAGWKGGKSAQQWRSSLRDHVNPKIGKRPIAEIGVGDVMLVLEPIWTRMPETAGRVRRRIESALDYATARGWRSGENPARWRGHMANLLPAASKLAKPTHYAAMPWEQIGSFLAQLRAEEGVAARALEFMVLTATRSEEARGARWAEIDLAQRVWTIPAERMKSDRLHRVPLSDRAMELVRSQSETREESEFVFPGARRGGELSYTAFSLLMQRLGRVETRHGFRSSFRDWVADTTNFRRELAEAALAHAVGDATEAAYQRSDLLDRRRQLMQAWATFCAQPYQPAAGAEVIQLHG